ncbi:hypothetical protein [Saccharopolyspora pogona]|uniref:hypothetical protein n=1 Tax=Saccharopolyspora pogona TaxID=333966 RepID=UPI001CC26CD5|nr:hypothetical protein [Saccharopolyspora pogona]
MRSTDTRTAFSPASTYHPGTARGADASIPSNVDFAATGSRSSLAISTASAPEPRTTSPAPLSVPATTSSPRAALKAEPANASPANWRCAAPSRIASASCANLSWACSAVSPKSRPSPRGGPGTPGPRPVRH